VETTPDPSGVDLPHYRLAIAPCLKGARGEYDIVADSNGRVLVVEVKNKLSRRMVDEFMEKKLSRFKELLPEYRDRRVLAGIGALVVKDDVGRYAKNAGLYVLTQTCDGGAAVLNRKGFVPREFL
jgi:RecB family endonuclease NucS